MKKDRLFLLIDSVEFTEIEVDTVKPIEMDFSITDFTNIGDGKAFVSHHIDIPRTAANDRNLQHISNKNSRGAQSLRGQQLKALLITKTSQQPGLFQFSKSNKNKNGKITHRGLFAAGTADWISVANQTKLNQLPLGTANYTKAAVETVFQDSNPYDGSTNVWYSLKNYGGTQSVIGLKPVEHRLIIPDVYAKSIYDAFEELTDYTIKSEFLNTEYFRRWLHPLTSGIANIELLQSSIDDRKVTALRSGTFSASVHKILFNQEIQDSFNQLDNSGSFSIFTPTVEGFYKVYLQITINSNTNAEFGAFRKSSDDTDLYTFIPQNGVNEIEFEVFAEHEGHHFYLNNISSVTSFYVEIEFQSTPHPIFEDVTYSVASLLPPISFTKYHKGISQLCNLITYTDSQKKEITIEPKFGCTLPTGEVIQGFYKSKAFARDWSHKVEAGHNTDYLQRNTARYLTLKYKSDRNDKAVGEYQELHSDVHDFGSQYKNSSRSIHNSLFAATKTQFDRHIGRNIPHLLIEPDVTKDVTPLFEFDMRVLYKFGYVTGSFEWYTSGNKLNSYPFAQNEPIAFDSTINWKGLKELFFERDFEIIAVGFRRAYTIFIENSDITQLDFRSPIYLNTGDENGYFILEKIERFNLSEGKGSCICQLIAIDV